MKTFGFLIVLFFLPFFASADLICSGVGPFTYPPTISFFNNGSGHDMVIAYPEKPTIYRNFERYDLQLNEGMLSNGTKYAIDQGVDDFTITINGISKKHKGRLGDFSLYLDPELLYISPDYKYHRIISNYRDLKKDIEASNLIIDGKVVYSTNTYLHITGKGKNSTDFILREGKSFLYNMKPLGKGYDEVLWATIDRNDKVVYFARRGTDLYRTIDNYSEKIASLPVGDFSIDINNPIYGTTAEDMLLNLKWSSDQGYNSYIYHQGNGSVITGFLTEIVLSSDQKHFLASYYKNAFFGRQEIIFDHASYPYLGSLLEMGFVEGASTPYYISHIKKKYAAFVGLDEKVRMYSYKETSLIHGEKAFVSVLSSKKGHTAYSVEYKGKVSFYYQNKKLPSSVIDVVADPDLPRVYAVVSRPEGLYLSILGNTYSSCQRD